MAACVAPDNAAGARLVGVGVVGLIAYYSQDLPDVRTLRDVEEPQTTRVVA